jgi:hypothetical protein
MQWEYKTTGRMLDPELDKLGGEGWELIAVVWIPAKPELHHLGSIGRLEFHFKRPKPEATRKEPWSP